MSKREMLFALKGKKPFKIQRVLVHSALLKALLKASDRLNRGAHSLFDRVFFTASNKAQRIMATNGSSLLCVEKPTFGVAPLECVIESRELQRVAQQMKHVDDLLLIEKQDDKNVLLDLKRVNAHEISTVPVVQEKIQLPDIENNLFSKTKKYQGFWVDGALLIRLLQNVLDAVDEETPNAKVNRYRIFLWMPLNDKDEKDGKDISPLVISRASEYCTTTATGFIMPMFKPEPSDDGAARIFPKLVLDAMLNVTKEPFKTYSA